MAADAKKLARIHRVRTLQLNLVRADEMAARSRFDSEAALSTRIAQLARAVAPTPDSAAGMSLAAAAHFRDRLQVSAEAATARVETARLNADRATEATRAARRDQTAVEKLLARAQVDAAIAAIRALESMPAPRKIRHDPC